MKVLSIDFDYFQDVTREQLALYPKGIDYTTSESEVEWGRLYWSFGDELHKIGILEDEFEKLKQLLTVQDIQASILIANSHINIYEFIKEQQQEMNDSDLSLVNVDMHHDFTNENTELDCGNWVMKLADEQMNAGHKMSFNWIANPISCDMYGFTEGELSGMFGKMIHQSLDRVEGDKFDAIFLCRSDAWLAPHLDKYFTETCDLILDRFQNIEFRDDVDLPRETYIELAALLKKIEKQCELEHSYA